MSRAGAPKHATLPYQHRLELEAEGGRTPEGAQPPTILDTVNGGPNEGRPADSVGADQPAHPRWGADEVGDGVVLGADAQRYPLPRPRRELRSAGPEVADLRAKIQPRWQAHAHRRGKIERTVPRRGGAVALTQQNRLFGE